MSENTSNMIPVFDERDIAKSAVEEKRSQLNDIEWKIRSWLVSDPISSTAARKLIEELYAILEQPWQF